MSEQSPIIDFHVHPSTSEHLHTSGGRYMAEMARYFNHQLHVEPVAEMVEKFTSAGVTRAVVYAWDAESATGLPATTNEHVAGLVSQFPDFLIGFASVDPWKGKRAVDLLRTAIDELGMRGLKLHPIAQEFYPNDPRFAPLFEVCVEASIPVVFHIGTTGWGAGLAGGGGVKLKYGRPIPYLDDLAADFPDLQIISAHPGWPWTEEVLAMVTHKPNVYMDLSGWRPKHLPPSVVSALKRQLGDRALFGTDYPFIEPKVWLDDFAKLELKDEIRSKVLGGNAARLLGLS